MSRPPEQRSRRVFPADPDVFERNLAGLLRRAPEPARLSPELRRRLLETWVSGCALQAKAVSPEPRIRPRPRLVPRLVPGLAAAAALLALLFAWSQLGQDESADPDALLARGEVALAPRGEPWRAATAAERAGAADTALLPLRVAVPEGDAFELALEEGSARVLGAARVELAGDPLQAGVEAGVLELERTPRDRTEDSLWTVRVGVASAELGAGRLRVARSADSTTVALLDGTASLRTLDGRRALVPGGRLVLRGGRVVAEEGPGPVASREPAPETPRTEDATREEVSVPAAPVAVEPPPSVRGVVVGPDGAPVPHFELALLCERVGNNYESAQYRAFDSADGAFVWSEVEPRRSTLYVFAPDLACATVGPLALDEGASDVGTIALTRGGALRGFVVDAERGDPIRDAIVLSEEATPQNFLPLGPELAEVFAPAQTATRADGSFVLRHLPAGTHHLRVTTPGRAPAWTPETQVAEGREADLGTIELGPGGAVAGHVLDEDGRPRAGALVIVTPMDQSTHRQVHFAMAHTDAEGAFRAEDLPAIRMLGVLVPLGPAAPPRVKPLTIVAGETSPLEFAPEANTTRIEGVLRDPDGSPVAGQNLGLIPPRASHEFANFDATSTDPTGRFAFESIAPGPQLLYQVSTEGKEIQLLGMLEATLPAGAPVVVVRSGHRIAGRVVDGITGREPGVVELIAGRVQPGSESPEFAGRIISDPSGAFAFEHLPDGVYTIVAAPQSDERGAVASAPLPLDALTPTQELELALVPGGTLVIDVVDAEGRPVAEAALELTDAHGLSLLASTDARTDERGRYVARGLPVGTYTIEVTDARGAESRRVSGRGTCRAGTRTTLVLRIPDPEESR